MTEANFWQAFKSHYPEIHWSRIENVAGAGIPDAHGQLDGTGSWLEMKVYKGEQLHVRTSQVAWHAQHATHGGVSYFVCRKKDSILVYYGTTIVQLAHDPKYCKVVTPKSVAIYPPAEAVLMEFKKPFDWKSLRQLLFGK